MRTHKQQLASILRRKEYQGCDGQITYYPDDNAHVTCRGAVAELFAPDTAEMRDRFPRAKKDDVFDTLHVAIIALNGE